MLPEVNILGHEIDYITIKTIHSKIAAIHKLPFHTRKVALMNFIGAPNFYTKFIEKLHIDLKSFYDLLRENTPWNWTEEHERHFETFNPLLLLEQNIPFLIQNIHFLITVDASLIGLGTVLFQLNEKKIK